jgi:hypothetical protein
LENGVLSVLEGGDVRATVEMVGAKVMIDGKVYVKERPACDPVWSKKEACERQLVECKLPCKYDDQACNSQCVSKHDVCLAAADK